MPCADFRPMLADPAPAELDFSHGAWLVSPKLDGVRAVVRGGVVLSRSLKPIPNPHVQELFGCFEHLDGELIVGSPTAPDVLRTTVSAVMKKTGHPSVIFHAFDHVERPTDRYLDRHNRMVKQVLDADYPWLERIQTTPITSLAKLKAYELSALKAGYEGIMLRRSDAPYKFGRSTAKEGYLLKLKRFSDAEFKVVGFEEREHNGNEATTNELGRTKRSSHKAGKTGRGDLGALVLEYGDTTFNCGTGFSDEDRAEIWANRPSYLGRLATIKYFAYGQKDVPKLTSFKAWRHPEDMS